MPTTIVPNQGAGVLLTQLGTGATPGYAALDFRRGDSLGVQEGVYNAGDFMVVQRAAGANMSVDIGMPAGGFACVQGDTIGGQGLYVVPVHSTTINEVIAAANATNPRVDSVILEIQDNVHDGSGGNQARTRVLTGTATAGTNLNTRAGAATVPGNALLLADVLVGAAAGSIPNTVIRDRRTWARGAYNRISRNTNASSTNDYTIATNVLTNIDGTNLAPRIECSGLPLRITLTGSAYVGTVNAAINFDVGVDGTGQGVRQEIGNTGEPALSRMPIAYQRTILPTVGSHVIAPMWLASVGSAFIIAQGTLTVELIVEEVVRQNSGNNTVTSG